MSIDFSALVVDELELGAALDEVYHFLMVVIVADWFDGVQHDDEERSRTYAQCNWNLLGRTAKVRTVTSQLGQARSS